MVESVRTCLMCSEPFDLQVREPVKLEGCCGVAICRLCVNINLNVSPFRALPECPSCSKALDKTPSILDTEIIESL